MRNSPRSARARVDGVELTGDDGLLTTLVRQVLQTLCRIFLLVDGGIGVWWVGWCDIFC